MKTLRLFIKLISLLLVFCMLTGMLVGCKEDADGDKDANAENGSDAQPPADPDDPTHVLYGKKVMFIGNSYTYYGRCVLEKKQDRLTQEERQNDKGYFYQLCRANGAKVEVTNWVWGGHNLDHLFGGSCYADRGCDFIDHLSYLTDRYFDYVVIQEGSGSKNYTAWYDRIMEIFREANPNVKFVIIAHHSNHTSTNTNYQAVRSELKNLETKGAIIADWGKMVSDIYLGNTEVPGATLTYDKNSFVVNWSEKDGYHPNMLTGYITALWVYCVITGEKAEGQPHDFCTDKSISSKFDIDAFCKKYYTYNGATTNIKEVFASDADMLGLQQLIDRYIAEKAYRTYP